MSNELEPNAASGEPDPSPEDLKASHPIYLTLFAGGFLLSMFLVVLVEAFRPH